MHNVPEKISHRIHHLTHTLSLMILALLLNGCAALLGELDPPRVDLVNIQLAKTEGLSQSFTLTLKLQNPNPIPLAIKGLAFDLSLLDTRFASGVSDQALKVAAFGEQNISVTVSTNLLSGMVLLQKLVQQSQGKPLTYQIDGKLQTGQGLLGSVKITQKGTIDLNI